MAFQDESAVRLSELAYEQAARAVEQQRQLLDSLRSRAGTMLSGATISTSFLGGQALAAGPLRATTWFAICSFVIVGMTSTAILWPRLAIETAMRPPAASNARETGLDGRRLASTLLMLAGHLYLSYDRNEQHIARIATYLRTGAVFLTFEVVWWVADLAAKG
jgi:hypothetical protein